MYNFQKWILRNSRKPFIALLFWFFCKFIFLINEIRDARFENSIRFEITFCSDLCNKLTASWWICALSSISDSLETSVNCFYCVILSFSVNSVTMLVGCHEVWRLTDFLQFLLKPKTLNPSCTLQYTDIDELYSQLLTVHVFHQITCFQLIYPGAVLINYTQCIVIVIMASQSQ